jgi:hypothetical protein
VLLNAERSFRRLKGHRQMPLLVAAHSPRQAGPTGPPGKYSDAARNNNFGPSCSIVPGEQELVHTRSLRGTRHTFVTTMVDAVVDLHDVQIDPCTTMR